MIFEYGTRNDDRLLETLAQLVQANQDSAQGFQEAAADVMDQELQKLFRRWSVERFQQAEVLRTTVHLIDRPKVSVGTWLDGWRRIWLSVRGALNAGDRGRVLRELERAENCVCKIVEVTLPDVRDPLIIDALGRQLNRMRETVDVLRNLRSAEPAVDSRQLDTWNGPPLDGAALTGAIVMSAEVVEQ